MEFRWRPGESPEAGASTSSTRSLLVLTCRWVPCWFQAMPPQKKKYGGFSESRKTQWENYWKTVLFLLFLMVLLIMFDHFSNKKTWQLPYVPSDVK